MAQPAPVSDSVETVRISTLAGLAPRLRPGELRILLALTVHAARVGNPPSISLSSRDLALLTGMTRRNVMKAIDSLVGAGKLGFSAGSPATAATYTLEALEIAPIGPSREFLQALGGVFMTPPISISKATA